MVSAASWYGRAASHQCNRRIPPRDAAVSPRQNRWTRRSHRTLRRVPPRRAASPPHHRRVQTYLVAIYLNIGAPIRADSFTVLCPYIARTSTVIAVRSLILQLANGAVQILKRRVTAASPPRQPDAAKYFGPCLTMAALWCGSHNSSCRCAIQLFFYQFPPIDQLTAQNYDCQFGTNVLGHFYFTKLLLPTLIKTAPPGKPARVINTASSAADFFGPAIHFNTLKDGPTRKKWSPEKLYFQSKFGNVAFSNELNRRYADQGIMSVALNPGNLKSNLQRHMSGVNLFLTNLILYPTPKGALTQLWAGTTEVGATLGGKHLYPWARIGKNPSKDPVAEKELWTWLEEQVADI
ncbi:hypothetical protein B0H16DRAFT_1797198 [Mycena metata]|uniref:NAD(P)-binding protein n=1 Tax=Mycena metata TaxID=1033252 RepID=A0AAD7HEC8_9AGAR|nr:hypothetical protein B0H16DRAFT_1797198 [Mycena metata]